MSLEFEKQQLVLYAKGHYGQVNYPHHLYYFVGLQNEENTMPVTDHHEFMFVAETYHILQKRESLTFQFERFITGAYEKAKRKGRNDVRVDDLVHQMFDELRLSTVTNEELGEKVNSVERFILEH